MENFGPLRIRTITYFTPNTNGYSFASLKAGAEWLSNARRPFLSAGYEVQMMRIATRNLIDSHEATTAFLKEGHAVEAMLAEHDVDLVSLGSTSNLDNAEHIVATIQACDKIHCTISLERGAMLGDVKRSAKCVLDIANATDGAGCFRFGVIANCQAGIPYFPVAYAPDSANPSFAIGMENSTVLAAALKDCKGDLVSAQHQLKNMLEAKLKPVHRIAMDLEEQTGVQFLHLDTSIAPGLDSPSMTSSFESLGLGPFGSPGTLSVSSCITAALKSINLRTGGYSGLMLPVCEDTGLAKMAKENAFGIQELLLYSSVCGCGLDTVPVPGYSGDPAHDEELESKIAAILMDIASMAYRLNKPLSCRLLPQPNKSPGQLTDFHNQYLVDTTIFQV